MTMHNATASPAPAEVLQERLETVLAEVRPLTARGRLADYIPELTKADPKALAACITDLDGRSVLAGDHDSVFTIQSVSKVAVFLYALEHCGTPRVLSRIGVEQTADAFNSIIKLETHNRGKPLNPFINAGAIALVAMLLETVGDRLPELLFAYIRLLGGNEALRVNRAVLESERSTGDINRALAYYQKGMKVFQADVNEVLEIYFQLCSLEVRVRDLAAMAAVIADNGVRRTDGRRFFSAENARCVKVLMTTCGLYDSSGWYALEVGVPTKSGVGGGMLSVVPGRFGVGVFGPALDTKGNSVGGVELLRRLSQALDWSIFL